MLEDIRSDIKRLIAAYEAARAENEELKVQLQQCKDRLEDDRKRISDLEGQIDSLKLADAITVTSKDKREARERIDRMIGAIDKCISLIES